MESIFLVVKDRLVKYSSTGLILVSFLAFTSSIAFAAPGLGQTATVEGAPVATTNLDLSGLRVNLSKNCEIEDAKAALLEQLSSLGASDNPADFLAAYQAKIPHRTNGTTTIYIQMLQGHRLKSTLLPVADSLLKASIKCTADGATLKHLEVKTFNVSNVETLSRSSKRESAAIASAGSRNREYHYLKFNNGWKETKFVVNGSSEELELTEYSGKSAARTIDAFAQGLHVEGQVRGRGHASGPPVLPAPDELIIGDYALRKYPSMIVETVTASDGTYTFEETDPEYQILNYFGYIFQQDSGERLEAFQDGGVGIECSATTTASGSGGYGGGCSWAVTDHGGGNKTMDIVFNTLSGQSESSTAVINAHHHVSKAWDWSYASFANGADFPWPGNNEPAGEVDPLPALRAYVTATTAHAPKCNSTYVLEDNRIYMGRAGSGTLPDGTAANCHNMAFDSPLYHEFGHAIDNWAGQNSLVRAERTGDQEVDGLSEGWGDIIASYMTNEPRIGRGVIQGDPESSIRNIDGEYQYDSVVPAPGDPVDDVYEYGQVWAAFAWHMRQFLILGHGASEGDAIARNLVMTTLAADPQNMLDALRELIMIDDDDTDPSNCTPNGAVILLMAERHGIPWDTIPEMGGVTIEQCAGDGYGVPLVESEYLRSSYYSMALTADGGAVLAGYVANSYSSGQMDLMFTKLAADGTKEWTNVIDYYTNHDDQINAITVDPQNRLVFAAAVGNPYNANGFGTWMPRYDVASGSLFPWDQMVVGYGALDQYGDPLGSRPIDAGKAIVSMYTGAGAHFGYSISGLTQSHAIYPDLCFGPPLNIKCADGFIGFLPESPMSGSLNPENDDGNTPINVYGGPATDAFLGNRQDLNGDLVTVGYTGSTTFTIPGGETQTITLAQRNAVVVKSDAGGNPLVSGNPEQVAKILGGNGLDMLISIDAVQGTSGQDGYIAVGLTTSDIDTNEGGNDIYIVRLENDLSLEPRWVRTLGTGYDEKGIEVRTLPGVGSGYAILAETQGTGGNYAGSMLFELSADGSTVTGCHEVVPVHFKTFEIQSDGSYFLVGDWGSATSGTAMAIKISGVEPGNCGLQ